MSDNIYFRDDGVEIDLMESTKRLIIWKTENTIVIQCYDSIGDASGRVEAEYNLTIDQANALSRAILDRLYT